jgi:hypothetical protein
MTVAYLVLLGFVGVVAILWLPLFIAATLRGRDLTNCPNCHSNRLRPSWPRKRDKLLKWTSIKPLRCLACQKRFYVRC